MTSRPPTRTLLAGIGVAGVLAATLAGPVLAGKHVTGGSGSCVPSAPSVVVENTWAWAATGSYGLPGQRLGYQLGVTNNDAGCRSSTFSVGLAAPAGFGVSIPASSVSLKAGSSAMLMAYVTSPGSASDGSFPLVASVVRSGTTSPVGTDTSHYKVYTSDATAATLYWPSPGDGQSVNGRTFWIQVSAIDDHAVRTIELAIDGVHVMTASCDDIAYTQSLAYKWSTVKGSHAATFTATDWMGNESTLTVAFTVG
jgi:hypothetical protein